MKNKYDKDKKYSNEEPEWRQKQLKQIEKFQKENNKFGDFNERVRKGYESGVDMGGSYTGTDEFGNM